MDDLGEPCSPEEAARRQAWAREFLKAANSRKYREADLAKAREKERRRSRKYREANLAKVREQEQRRNRKYREANRDKVRELSRLSMRKCREADPEKFRERERRYAREVKRKWPVDAVAFARRFQKGQCMLCDRVMDTEQRRRPRGEHADHCHTTKQPRWLLCGACNTSLGMYEKHQRPAGLLIEPYEKYLAGPFVLDVMSAYSNTETNTDTERHTDK